MVFRMVKKRNINSYRRYDKFLPTTDDWYPNYDNDMVKVSVILTTEIWGKPSVQFCVWGNDDFGMERPEYFATKKEARQKYKEIVRTINNWSIVTKEMLKDLNFKMA